MPWAIRLEGQELDRYRFARKLGLKARWAYMHAIDALPRIFLPLDAWRSLESLEREEARGR